MGQCQRILQEWKDDGSKPNDWPGPFKGLNDDCKSWKDEVEKGGGFYAIPSTKSLAAQMKILLQHTQDGNLKKSPNVTLQDLCGAHLPYSTDTYEIVKAKQMPCFQAVVVHACAMALNQLGIPQVPCKANVVRPFAQLFDDTVTEFSHSNMRDSRWMLKRCQHLDRASDVFTMTSGIFIITCTWFHYEDWDCQYAEGIAHYIAYNAGTGLLMLYPEVIIVLDSDRQDMQGFLKKLECPPYQVQFRTTSDSYSDVRQLYIRADACATTPQCSISLQEAAATWQARKRKRDGN